MRFHAGLALIAAHAVSRRRTARDDVAGWHRRARRVSAAAAGTPRPPGVMVAAAIGHPDRLGGARSDLGGGDRASASPARWSLRPPGLRAVRSAATTGDVLGGLSASWRDRDAARGVGAMTARSARPDGGRGFPWSRLSGANGQATAAGAHPGATRLWPGSGMAPVDHGGRIYGQADLSCDCFRNRTLYRPCRKSCRAPRSG